MQPARVEMFRLLGDEDRLRLLALCAEEELTVGAGHVVVVPAQTPHRFEAVGDEVLRVVSVHPSPQVEQTDL